VPTAADAPPPILPCAPPTRATPLTLEGHWGWVCANAQGQMHGPFLLLHPDGSTAITGSYQRGVLDGPWRRLYPNGKTAEVGAFTMGQRDGLWQRYADTGGLLGDFQMTRGTGVDRRWHADGQLASERAYADGLLDGPSRVYGYGGLVLYEAQFARGLLDGRRRLGTSKGMRIEDRFAAGVPRGSRKLWRRDTLTLEMSFDDEGNLHGPFSAWRDRSTLRERGAFVRGDRHGTWQWIGRGRELERQGSYFLGLRHGTWRQWDGGRLIMQGRYVKGRPHGTFRFWSSGGAAIGKCKLKNGTGEMLTFHDNGQLATRTPMVRGLRHGIYQELNPRGKVVLEGAYASDQRHGLWIERDGEGRVARQSTYVDGKLDGVVRRYVRGELASEVTYALGVREGPYRELQPGADGELLPAVTGAFAADLKSGPWVFRRPDGRAMEVTYVKGDLQGPWQQRGAEGDLSGQHDRGRRVGTWTWTARGTPKRTITYPQP
ncbi:MAG TPA: hypothetical protein PKU97_14075, partial [Kofleriaceae bacterium]|nr:hypothetical protein [Kofleriaceae bacterium]